MIASPSRHWTFLSNHAHVLVCLAQDPDARLRDVALSVGITERAVQKIVSDLEEAGALVRERAGRRNSYRLNLDVPLRHALESHKTVGTLLSLVLDRAGLKRVRSA
jgi:DNA-binding IclR family transcriptional regulator